MSRRSKVTDAPICSIAAKYMTVFASSLEKKVTTLFGVDVAATQNSMALAQKQLASEFQTATFTTIWDERIFALQHTHAPKSKQERVKITKMMPKK